VNWGANFAMRLLACELLRLILQRPVGGATQSPQRLLENAISMDVEWLSIFLSALASGLLSLLISHAYYKVSIRSAERHHAAQLEATARRHAEQMERMASHHAEQLLVLRTTLLAVEKDSGVEAARDREGKLTGGLHHEGQFIAPPQVSSSAVANNIPSSAEDENSPK
jgi:hypothetical protein